MNETLLRAIALKNGTAEVDEPYRLPPTVRIGSYTFKVERDASLHRNGTDGECQYSKERIVIAADSPSHARDATTILHEFVHAISQDRAANLKEQQVETVTNGLYALLTDLGWMPREVKLADDP